MRFLRRQAFDRADRRDQPVRLRLRRGRRTGLPDGAVFVGRPSPWGNPFAVTRSSDFHGLAGSWFLRGPDGGIHHPDQDTQRSARLKAVELYTASVLAGQNADVNLDVIVRALEGRDLACWCPLDEPCHADFLLRVANAAASGRPSDFRVGATPPRSQAVCQQCGAQGSELSVERQHVPGPGAARDTGRGANCSTCGRPHRGSPA